MTNGNCNKVVRRLINKMHHEMNSLPEQTKTMKNTMKLNRKRKQLLSFLTIILLFVLPSINPSKGVIAQNEKKSNKVKLVSFNMDAQGHIYYVENNRLLPLKNDNYQISTVPYLGYKVDLRLGWESFGFRFQYSDNNWKPGLSDEILKKAEDKSKTVQRIFKSISYIPILPRKGVSFYGGYNRIQFQNGLHIKNALNFDQETLLPGDYRYSSFYEEYMLGFRKAIYKNKERAEFASGLHYSVLHFPSYTDDKLIASNTTRYQSFIKFDYVNEYNDDFFELLSYGYQWEIGLAKTQLASGEYFSIDNKKDFISSGITYNSKVSLFKNASLSLAGGHRMLIPATTFGKVFYGFIAAPAIGGFSVVRVFLPDSFEIDDDYWPVLNTVLTPIYNFLYVKANNFYWKKATKGRRTMDDVSQSELYYSLAFNFYF